MTASHYTATLAPEVAEVLDDLAFRGYEAGVVYSLRHRGHLFAGGGVDLVVDEHIVRLVMDDNVLRIHVAEKSRSGEFGLGLYDAAFTNAPAVAVAAFIGRLFEEEI